MTQEVYTDLENKDVKVPEQLFMYDWLFHFNPYTGSWNAIPRELYVQYINEGYELANVLRAKHLNVLLDLLHKFKGDAEEIRKISTDVS